MPACSANSNRAARRIFPVALLAACCGVTSPAIAQAGSATLAVFAINAAPGAVAMPGAQSALNQDDLTQHFSEAAFSLMLGLPLATQLDSQLPRAHRRAQSVMAHLEGPAQHQPAPFMFEIGLSRQLFNEAHRLPAVRDKVHYRYAAVTEKSGSNTAAGNIFNLGKAGVTLVKRFEPLVFFAAVNRSFYAPRTINGLPIDPGNPTTVKLGSIYALGPATSMRMAVELTRAAGRDAKGDALPGTGQLGAVLSASYSIVVAPRVVFSVEAGIGLHSHSPNVRFIASMPLQF